MRCRLFSITIAVALLAGPGSAAADGFYAGAGIGAMQIEDAGPGYSVSDFPFGSRLFVGVEINQKFAIEGVFFSSDTATQGNGLPETRADFSGLALFATGLVPTGDRGQFMVRLGLFTGDLEIESSARDFDRRKQGLALGAGYVLSLNEHFAIRGDFDTFIAGYEKLSSGTIGIQYRFGD